MPASSRYGSSGRVGGGSASAAMRGSAYRPAPKPKKPTTYHGTSWKYKPGDVTTSTSASTSYSTAKKYSTSSRAVSREEFSAKVAKRKPNPKAYGKPTVYKVKPASGKTVTSQRKYRTSKSEVNSPGGWKIQGKAKAPKATMKTSAKPSSKGSGTVYKGTKRPMGPM